MKKRSTIKKSTRRIPSKRYQRPKYVLRSPTGSKKHKRGEFAQKEVEYYQERLEKHDIPRIAIYRLIRSIIGTLKIEKEAVDIIHRAVEEYIRRLYHHAKILLPYGRGQRSPRTGYTLLPKDIDILEELGEAECCLEHV